MPWLGRQQLRCVPHVCLLTALCPCLQGTSGPDPTTVYVDMRALRHDRYGVPVASARERGGARLPQAVPEGAGAPLPLEGQDALSVGDVNDRGCRAAFSPCPRSSRLALAVSAGEVSLHTPNPTRFLPEPRRFRKELKCSQVAFCAASEWP